MSEEKTEKLYEKLRKLMALKDSAMDVGSVGEAEAAAAAIQRLLREYNLSEDEIPTEERIANPMVIEKLPFYYTYRNQWFSHLVATLCVNNLCKIVSVNCMVGSRTTSKELAVLGRKTNVETVTFLALQLANKFVYFCRQAYAEYYMKRLYEGVTPASEAKFAFDYLLGCVSGLDAKLKAQQVVTEQSLVLSREAELNTFMYESFENIQKGRNRRVNYKDNKTFKSGYEKGQNVDINQGIDKQKPGQQKLI